MLDYYRYFTKVPVFFFEAVFQNMPVMLLITGILPSAAIFRGSFPKKSINVNVYRRLVKVPVIPAFPPLPKN
jgi:hypothetical protein